MTRTKVPKQASILLATMVKLIENTTNVAIGITKIKTSDKTQNTSKKGTSMS
jgi:hypothetical protein